MDPQLLQEHKQAKLALFWIEVALVLAIIMVAAEIAAAVLLMLNMGGVWPNELWQPVGLVSAACFVLSLYARHNSQCERPASWKK